MYTHFEFHFRFHARCRCFHFIRYVVAVVATAAALVCCALLSSEYASIHTLLLCYCCFFSRCCVVVFFSLLSIHFQYNTNSFSALFSMDSLAWLIFFYCFTSIPKMKWNERTHAFGFRQFYTLYARALHIQTIHYIILIMMMFWLFQFHLFLFLSFFLFVLFNFQ